MTELTQLKFSTPEPRYDSVARFENNKGQEFHVRVSGSNRTLVEQYTKNIRAYFEVMPKEFIQPNSDTSSEHNREIEQPWLPEETLNLEGTVEPLSTDCLDVVLEVAKTPNIDYPKLFSFHLERAIERIPIDGDSSQITRDNYPIPTFGRPQVTVKVTDGKVLVELFQIKGSRRKSEDREIVSANEGKTLTTPNNVTAGTQFSISVTGLGDSRSYYIITGTWQIQHESQVRRV